MRLKEATIISLSVLAVGVLAYPIGCKKKTTTPTTNVVGDWSGYVVRTDGPFQISFPDTNFISLNLVEAVGTGIYSLQGTMVLTDTLQASDPFESYLEDTLSVEGDYEGGVLHLYTDTLAIDTVRIVLSDLEAVLHEAYEFRGNSVGAELQGSLTAQKVVSGDSILYPVFDTLTATTGSFNLEKE